MTRYFIIINAPSLSCFIPSVIFKHFYNFLYFHGNSSGYYNLYGTIFQPLYIFACADPGFKVE